MSRFELAGDIVVAARGFTATGTWLAAREGRAGAVARATYRAWLAAAIGTIVFTYVL